MPITTREKMKEFRKLQNLTVQDMARMSNVSTGLLFSIENGDITHPNIAARIGSAYMLTDIETEDLMPLHHRVNGGCYDPEKFVRAFDENRFILPVPTNHRKGDYQT